MKISEHQRKLMNQTVKDGRNFYGAMRGDADATAFEHLVEAGYALKLDAPAWMIDDVIFHLTSAGKNALIVANKAARQANPNEEVCDSNMERVDPSSSNTSNTKCNCHEKHGDEIGTGGWVCPVHRRQFGG